MNWLLNFLKPTFQKVIFIITFSVLLFVFNGLYSYIIAHCWLITIFQHNFTGVNLQNTSPCDNDVPLLNAFTRQTLPLLLSFPASLLTISQFSNFFTLSGLFYLSILLGEYIFFCFLYWFWMKYVYRLLLKYVTILIILFFCVVILVVFMTVIFDKYPNSVVVIAANAENTNYTTKSVTISDPHEVKNLYTHLKYLPKDDNTVLNSIDTRLGCLGFPSFGEEYHLLFYHDSRLVLHAHGLIGWCLPVVLDSIDGRNFSADFLELLPQNLGLNNSGL